MFVRSLNIKEFRGIKECATALKFSNFTVLIGKNNAGKSAILEALSLLPDPNINDYITRTSKINSLQNLHQGSRKALLYLYAGTSDLQFGIRSSSALIEISLIFSREISSVFSMYAPWNVLLITLFFIIPDA